MDTLLFNELQIERKSIRQRRVTLNKQLKDKKSHLKQAKGTPAADQLKSEIVMIEEELHATHASLAELADRILPMELEKAGEDGILPGKVSLILSERGLSDEDIQLFAGKYRECRSANANRHMPPLKNLASQKDAYTALVACTSDSVWMDDVSSNTHETWSELQGRVDTPGMTKAAFQVIEAHLKSMSPGSSNWVGQSLVAMVTITSASAIADDIPTTVTAFNAATIIAYASLVMAHSKEAYTNPDVAPRQTYSEFEKATYDEYAAAAKAQDPRLISCVAPYGDDMENKLPDTAYWFGNMVPTADMLGVWNAAISQTISALTPSSPSVTLGEAPIGCIMSTDTPFNTGHDLLLRTVKAAFRFIDVFILNPKIADTSKDDQISHWAFQQPLVWCGGLGFDVLRLAFSSLADQGIEGADYYANLKNEEITKILSELSSRNSMPVSGFGVLLPDYPDFLQCVVATGLVPRWMEASLYLTMFKYVSVEIDRSDGTERQFIIIDFRDSKVCLEVADGFYYQPLSEGGKGKGHGALREAIERHLNLRVIFPDGMDNVSDQINALLASFYKRVRPADFPHRTPLTVNPFLITSPSPPVEVELDRYDGPRSFFRITRKFALHRFNPGLKALYEDYSTPAETLYYGWPRTHFNAVAHAKFLMSLPDKIEPKKFSEYAEPYLKHFDDLGYLVGMLQSMDVLLGVDLSKQLFPDAPVVIAAAAQETPLVFFVPTDASDPDAMTNHGKSKGALAICGTANLYLITTPTKSGDSAPSQRTLVVAFYKCDNTFYVDDAREITSADHMLSDNNLRTIATEGRGASAGLAGQNADILIFKHFVTFTAKYVPQEMPDIPTRCFVYYVKVLTDDNRLSSPDFSYFSSLKFRLTARLNYICWMYSSGFYKTIYDVKPRVSVLRHDGHNGIAGALLGDGKTVDADMTHFNDYIRESQGPKCKAQYAQAIDSGVVEYNSGRTVIDPAIYFRAALVNTLLFIASQIRDEVSMGAMEMWRRLVTDNRTDDYSRVANTEGFAKVGLKKLSGQFMKAAVAELLVRDDGWSAIIKTITLVSGARAPRILLVNETQPEFSTVGWDKTLGMWHKKYTKKQVEA